MWISVSPNILRLQTKKQANELEMLTWTITTAQRKKDQSRIYLTKKLLATCNGCFAVYLSLFYAYSSWAAGLSQKIPGDVDRLGDTRYQFLHAVCETVPLWRPTPGCCCGSAYNGFRCGVDYDGRLEDLELHQDTSFLADFRSKSHFLGQSGKS